MKIDFVSDIACPWCAVGLYSLEIALTRIGEEIPINLGFQPYELNPAMAREGVDAADYLSKKYGMSAGQLEASRENLRARGAEVGFTFGERLRVWNTFDAHRLMLWAGPQGKQRALKHALLRAYHAEGKNPSDPDTLLALSAEVGLETEAARAIIDGNDFAQDVRDAEAFWQRNGITAVPSVIIDDQHLLQGGQPPEVFERAIRQIAASTAHS